MIDKTKLNTKIEETAERIFADIHLMNEIEIQDNLEYFATKAKEIAESILEQYTFGIVAKYTEGDFVISDIDKLSDFCSFTNGYQHQMLDWISTHKLDVTHEKFDFPQKASEENEKNMISPKVILGIGSFVAVGLFIFTNIWIALAAEIITIAMAYIQKKRISRQKEQQILEQERYEMMLKDKKNKLVYGMIEELDKWLEMGVEASDKIINSFNIR